MVGRTLLGGKKILIVDDEPDVLDSLEELLTMCDVLRASSFEEAKALLESQPFDLAILDIMGVQGYKLLDLALEKKVISIMLTAHALTPEETVRSYKKGAAFFVPKDRLVDIATCLNDVLEAKEKGTITGPAGSIGWGPITTEDSDLIGRIRIGISGKSSPDKTGVWPPSCAKRKA